RRLDEVPEPVPEPAHVYPRGTHRPAHFRAGVPGIFRPEVGITEDRVRGAAGVGEVGVQLLERGSPEAARAADLQVHAGWYVRHDGRARGDVGSPEVASGD